MRIRQNWDMAGEFVEDNTLTVYMKRLREKIEDNPARPEIIKTIRGMGYGVFLTTAFIVSTVTLPASSKTCFFPFLRRQAPIRETNSLGRNYGERALLSVCLQHIFFPAAGE